MYAIRSYYDADRVLVLEGAALQRREERVEIGQQDIGGAHELHVEAGRNNFV